MEGKKTKNLKILLLHFLLGSVDRFKRICWLDGQMNVGLGVWLRTSTDEDGRLSERAKRNGRQTNKKKTNKDLKKKKENRAKRKTNKEIEKCL